MPWVPVGGGAAGSSSSSSGRRRHGPKSKAPEAADADSDWRRPRPADQGTPQPEMQQRVPEPESTGPAEPASPSMRTSSVGAARPRRMAWADMASDDSGSEPDFDGLGPASPSSSSAAHGATKPSPRGKESNDTSAEAAQASQEPADRWALDLLAMAGRLQELAKAAPSTDRVRRFCEYAGTEVSGAEVDSWASAAAALRALRSEQQQAHAEMLAAESDEAEAERLCDSATAAVAFRAAVMDEERAARVLQDQQWSLELFQVASSLEAAQDAATSIERQAAIDAETEEACMTALRQRLAAEVAEADAAEAEVTRNLAAREARKAMPELRKRRKAGEASADKAEAACKASRTSLEQLRAEIAAAKEAADARATPLEARRAQLETDCSELQQALASPLPAEISAANEKEAAKKLEEELKAAQATNRDLLESVRKVRAAKGGAKAELETLRSEIADFKSVAARLHVEGLELTQQMKESSSREAAARAEVEGLKATISEAAKQVQESEEKAKNDRAKQAEVEASRRGLLLARRRTEEVATVLEWRLQKAAMQLEKDQPGTSLVKHLLNSDGQARMGLKAAPRSKRYMPGKGSLGPGSDAEMESTTAASETVAECWP
eukprot:gb/GFBE01039210.1/.p1 GENE.gb/GFBE01039210.1/~~gb/GFBE01039210.1/.p1  ORF type:complete len:612 (+),score=157.46 gb/GFBE01039210.1/:1-1836(+)